MLKKAICTAGILSVSVILANAASSEQTLSHDVWGEAGGWNVKIDPSVSNGCYIERNLEDGTLVRVGYVPDRKGGFFAAYNAAWTNIKEGVAGTIQFDFGQSRFEGEYIGDIVADLRGGYAFFNNPEFLQEFGKRNDVSIKGDGEDALAFKLSGTAKAINAMQTCDAEQSR